MKKQDRLKSIQLIVFIALTVVCFCLVIFNGDIYHSIAHDANIRLVCVLLWVSLLLSFVFILLDFNFASSFKKDFRELDYAVHSDPLSGLANRLAADTIVEKYLDMPVPEDFGCIMMELSNIREINELHGHVVGNQVIKTYSDILNSAVTGGCTVARNGGNKFLAIFEKTDGSDINEFLRNVEENVKAHNARPGSYSILYRYGVAFHEEEPVKSVPELISLANKRITKP